MELEEKNLIEKLFQRLQKAEENSSVRDCEAEKLIQDCISKQPISPYYMVQTILIQEAALNKLNQEILKLKNEIFQLQMNQNKDKSFLGRLFNSNQTAQSAPTNNLHPFTEANNSFVPSNMQARNSTSSFMSGALQTAVGVAGGVVIGNMLSNMFHHSAPEEILNVIDDPGSMNEGDPFSSDLSLDADNHLDMLDHDSDSQVIDCDDQISDNDFELGGFGDDDFI
ncbi:DUF2076 domain-containing protein [Candidatus Pantoea edessiphila]|uniref:ABC transporter substrate-binding protein n=1 Tax=Candidatus Pantoea edessiphila TaxID=2044610 RepID=A0A2P5SV59_9GAMM|nr:DUF2076 family protein [Candidatus Pantoea edessiphila]PPI86258.1 ABC transporter substrate-binding protein [Candidatus Pantoea edessiphila]